MSFNRLFFYFIAALAALMLISYENDNLAESASNSTRWLKAGTPGQGAEHGWLMASGSDITCLAADSNGMLYAGVTGMPSNLYKSPDDGQNWQAIGSDTGIIIDMVITEDDILYFATYNQIFKSVNDRNIVVASLSGSFTDPDTAITSFDVSFCNGSHTILVGTKNKNSGQFGGAYVIYDDMLMQWQDLGLADCDVYSVAFSPRFQEDNFIVAMTSDETDTCITWKTGSGAWGRALGNAVLKDGQTGNPVAVNESAEIVFPDDYCSDATSGRCVLYAALDTGTNEGDVYIVYGQNNPEQSIAEDLDVAASYGENGIDITGLDVCGDIGSIYIMAGSSSSADIYISSDGGNSWEKSSKSPSGERQTSVFISADFQNNGKAYSATTGYESAFSVSCDYGINWNQCGLIDTTIDIIIDAAVSPAFDDDKTVFLLSWGNGYSLWRSTDGGGNWQRILGGFANSNTGIDKIALSPHFGNGSNVLYFCGSENGNPTLWKSADNGDSFSSRSMPFSVDCWEIIDDSSFYIAGFDGTDALLYRTVDSGAHYKYKSTAGNQSLISLALSPDYSVDGNILAGNYNGDVYLSTDRGMTFLQIGQASSPLAGRVSVVFDADYTLNGIVYAAGDMSDNGIYRFVTGQSLAWEAINATLPAGAIIGGLEIAENGVLYAMNYQQVSNGGGLERSIDPASGNFFETFAAGLEADTTLVGLWLTGNTLWAVDTMNNSLFYFKDKFSGRVNLSSPSDCEIVKAALSDNTIKNILLDWEPLEGAGSYLWQLSDDANFSSSSIIAEDTTSASSVKLNPLEPGETYYWRVRTETPLLSHWSAIWSFTPQAVIDLDTPILESPAAGAANVSVNTMFQWTAVDGAESYELEISTQYDFTNPVVRLAETTAIPVNAWQNPNRFAYSTTYYWRVRAVNSDTISSWSGAGVFATVAADTTQTSTSSIITQTQSTQTLISFTTIEKLTTTTYTEYPTITITQTRETGAPVQQNLLIPDWLYYAFGFMALVIVCLLTVILIIVVKKR
jgi:photosystem II stability/assembly factor-like uncharacterized protein